MSWLSLIPKLFDVGGSIIGGWMDRKKIAAESKVRIDEARATHSITMAQNQQVADNEWDVQNTVNAQSSWKDEYWTLILSIPAILCFISEEWANKVRVGFDALANTPDWYQIALLVAIATAFGYKKIVEPFLNRVKGA